MICSPMAFVDGQGALVERLGLWILGHVIQVGTPCYSASSLLPGRSCSSVEYRCHTAARVAGTCDSEARFQPWEGEEFAYDSHDAFSPVLLGLLVHLIDEHGLDEPVDGEGGGLLVAGDERVGQQCSHGLIQRERVAGKRLEQRAERARALGNQCFGNGIRREKRTEAQEFRRCGVGLLDLLKGE